MFDKYELGILRRALGRTIQSMRKSEYIVDSDPHLAKCEKVFAKAVAAEKARPEPMEARLTRLASEMRQAIEEEIEKTTISVEVGREICDLIEEVTNERRQDV